MSQISPPIRIVLIFAVVFLAAWFTVLKPKEPEVAAAPAAAAPPAVATPESTAGQFQAKAQAGAAQAEADAAGAANANLEGDAGTTAAAPSATGTATAAPTTTAPAAPLPALDPKALKGLPPALRTGLEQRKVLVLGVLDTAAEPWAPMADDDRAVRNLLERVNRYDGSVVVRTAPIARLARYDGLLKALEVSQSPTVVVIDRNRHATALTGYVDRVSVNQAIADARRSGTRKLIKDAYLRSTNVLCGRYNLRVDRWSQPTVRGAGPAQLRRLLRLGARYRAAFAKVPAPARWRPLRAQIVRHLRADEAAGRALLRGNGSAAAAARERLVTSGKAIDARFNAVGLTACASVRTR